MAKNKSSRFGVADNLQYSDDSQNQFNIDKLNNESPVTQPFNQHFANFENNHQKSVNNKKLPKREGAYRFSLYMDPDLGEYLNYMKFKQRKSITDLFNDIVREKMESDISWKNLKK